MKVDQNKGWEDNKADLEENPNPVKCMVDGSGSGFGIETEVSTLALYQNGQNIWNGTQP